MSRQLFSRNQTKAPKIRFKLGEWFLYNGHPYVIVYAYRVQDEPNIWYYAIEDAPYDGYHPILSPETQERDRLISCIQSIDPKYAPPAELVVYKTFINHSAAGQYFFNVGAKGTNRVIMSNQNMMKLKRHQKGEE